MRKRKATKRPSSINLNLKSPVAIRFSLVPVHETGGKKRIAPWVPLKDILKANGR